MSHKIDCPPAPFEMLKGSKIYQHGFLPVAASYCRKLGLIELINRLVPTQMELSPGLAVQAMVLDTLSGRSPVYRVEQFLEQEDAHLMLGESVEPHQFNDTNLGRSLDAIFEAGTANILTDLGAAAVKSFDLDASVISYDTTSTNVWGEYTTLGEDSRSGPNITYGHSKDHRPDLKQFMTELLCVERGIPIFGSTLDGNSSDKTSNNEMLGRISSIMKRNGLGPGAFLYVADSALITKNNLEAMDETLFVSRLPATYSECNRAIQVAVDVDAWNDIGIQSQNKTGAKRPNASYKLHETTVTLYEKEYRAVVIHSSAHDKRREKRLNKRLIKSAKELGEKLKNAETIYHCKADALSALKRIEAVKSALHSVSASIEPFEVRKRGRPPKNGPPPTLTRYKIAWIMNEQAEAVERERKIGGCFVLLSNAPAQGDNEITAQNLLIRYKGQYGVESDFAFLKDPLIVNDLFLKSPERIDALGMILIIALLVWRLMERSMRAYIHNNDDDLPGWDGKRTKRPTAFMISINLTGIIVICKDGIRSLLRGPPDQSAEYLRALGVSKAVFTEPRYRCRPINRVPAS
jgi:transposase